MQKKVWEVGQGERLLQIQGSAPNEASMFRDCPHRFRNKPLGWLRIVRRRPRFVCALRYIERMDSPIAARRSPPVGESRRKSPRFSQGGDEVK